MTRITVVIEDHAEGIHLGKELAGGRVVAACHGDHSELLEPLRELLAVAEQYDLPLSDPERIAARSAIAKAHA